MNKGTLYWLCQIGGWFLFVLMEFIGYGNIFGYSAALVINVSINFMAGILLTHFYRWFIIRTGWIGLEMRRLIPRAMLGVIVISVMMTFMNIYLDRFTVPEMQQLPVNLILFLNYLFNWSKYILVWALVYHLFQYWENALEAEKLRYQLQATLRENQYHNLKNQLNPHFLFNALNSIRTLVDLQPDLAKEAITRLSSLLRSSLQMSREKTVTLAREMETVDDYLAIERIRFDDRLQVTTHIPVELLQVKVPPMMLQTLVENAVKHGISKARAGGIIEIEASANADRIKLMIRNTGRYQPDATHTGFGLANTRERLQILYDVKASLNIENGNNGDVITTIEIPI